MKLKKFKTVGESLIIYLSFISIAFFTIVVGVGGDIWFQDLDEKLILQER
jgi:hypothetical protein